MGEYFDMWWGGGTWYDRKQQEQISALSASHARTTSRLRRQMRAEARRTEDLGERLSRLEDAVVAMVELEDLRGVMENFSDAVGTRQYARDVLAKIPALKRVPRTRNPEVPPDVPDYWLHPAIRSLDAQIDGDLQTSRAAANQARQRDPARTAQFLAAAAILLGAEAADDDLATLWPSTRAVSTYQRSLWLAVANGGLGEDARDGLVDALAWAIDRPLESEPHEADPMRLVRVSLPRQQRHTDSLEEVVLTALAGSSRMPDEPDRAARLLSTLRQRVTNGLEAELVPLAEGEVPDGVADLLAQVVSAGAPGEESIVQRIGQIREALAAIGAQTSISTPATLDEQSLDVVELLTEDLSDAADPGARAVALRVLQRPIESVATRLADVAARPLPDASEVRVPGGVTVTVSPAGAMQGDWRQTLTDRVMARQEDPRRFYTHIIGGGVAALLGLILGIVVHPGWYVLVLGAGLAGYGVWMLRSARQTGVAQAARMVREAEKAIETRASELAGSLAAMRERQAMAPSELQMVLDAFASGVRA